MQRLLPSASKAVYAAYLADAIAAAKSRRRHVPARRAHLRGLSLGFAQASPAQCQLASVAGLLRCARLRAGSVVSSASGPLFPDARPAASGPQPRRSSACGAAPARWRPAGAPGLFARPLPAAFGLGGLSPPVGALGPASLRVGLPLVALAPSRPCPWAVRRRPAPPPAPFGLRACGLRPGGRARAFGPLLRAFRPPGLACSRAPPAPLPLLPTRKGRATRARHSAYSVTHPRVYRTTVCAPTHILPREGNSVNSEYNFVFDACEHPQPAEPSSGLPVHTAWLHSDCHD